MDPSQRIGSLMRITLADEPGVKQEQQRRPHVRREPHPARGMGEPATGCKRAVIPGLLQ
jgi:hypothetical protein